MGQQSERLHWKTEETTLKPWWGGVAFAQNNGKDNSSSEDGKRKRKSEDLKISFSFSLFWHRISLCSPGWPWTSSIRLDNKKPKLMSMTDFMKSENSEGFNSVTTVQFKSEAKTATVSTEWVSAFWKTFFRYWAYWDGSWSLPSKYHHFKGWAMSVSHVDNIRSLSDSYLRCYKDNYTKCSISVGCYYYFYGNWVTHMDITNMITHRTSNAAYIRRKNIIFLVNLLPYKNIVFYLLGSLRTLIHK